jgi:glycosyltransferase involved in cell wall biosynthesis
MDILQAVYRIHREADVQALMVGDGPLRGACEEFVRENDLPVRFAGFLNQSKIVGAYLASDLLILPSDGETWGLVVNEAMACGRPCLVSDQVGCGPDLVIPEETGVTFQRCNVPALVAAILKLARNPSQIAAMGLKARDHLRNYSIGVAVEGVLKSLASTVGPGAITCA